MPDLAARQHLHQGLLGIDQRKVVTAQVARADAAARRRLDGQGRRRWPIADIEADPALMRPAQEAGRTLFGDNCAACHGVNGTGGPGFPNLAAKAWLWGGEPETIDGDDPRRHQLDPCRHPRLADDGLRPRRHARPRADRQCRRLCPLAVRTAASRKATPNASRPAARSSPTTASPAMATTPRAITTSAPEPDRCQLDLWRRRAIRVQHRSIAGRQGHMPHWSDRLSPAADQASGALRPHAWRTRRVTARRGYDGRAAASAMAQANGACHGCRCGLAVLLGANAHLVYVAFDVAAGLRAAREGSRRRRRGSCAAARSAC